MLMNSGGNSGSQSSVTIIRSLALGDITFADTWRIIFKEFRVAFICGLILSLANFVKMLFIDHILLGTDISVQIALVVSLTLLATVVIAKIIGCTLPLLAKKVGFDPAVMASPFITTLVDAISLILYFQIASALLGL